MQDYFELKLCGLTRHLPIKPVSKNTKMASFNILGDVELVEKAAKRLVKKLKGLKFDYLVGPEVKVVPLIHNMASILGHKKYVICRKSVKPHMISPKILKPLPYFPKHVRPLVIDGKDAQLLAGKKVVIVDDVVSTGVTMRMMKKLMENVGAEVVASFAIIRQGDAQFDEIENFTYLAKIPIFHLDKAPPHLLT